MLEPIETLQFNYYKVIETKQLCDATNINLPFNLPSINICIIPAYENILTAIGICIGLIIVSKLFWMMYYEYRYYNGAGEDYLKFGKNYVKNKFHKK